MQIICPNCGSKSPIEAGSLVTQTRIVCARCAVEFAAELSDEQAAAPAADAGERGIVLFQAAEVAPVFYAPVPQAQSVPVTEEADAAPAAEVAPAEVAPVEEDTAVAPAEEVAAVEPVQEATPVGDEVSQAVGFADEAEVAPVAVAPPAESSAAPAASEAYEVLSLPEEAVLSNETAEDDAAAEEDHLNVLDDVFAAWSQSRESKPESDAVVAAPFAAAEDYVTSPLAADYEAARREEQRPETESTESRPVDVVGAAADESVVSVETAPAEVAVAGEVTEAASASDDEAESVHETFADVSGPPQVVAAKSFDGYGLGVRLMRVSPLWLLVSGLSFISFVVFCNWFFVPANLAQAGVARPASHRNEATNRPLAAAEGAAAEPADSRNDDAGRASLPREAEVVNATLKIEEPTPAPTVAATPAPTAEPVATPNAEQPKAAETVAPQPAPSGRFTVQVGSYSAANEAEARAAVLRSAGQTVRVAEVEIPKRGKWYRVYVGGFASRADAESHGKSLRERGLAESFIATESN
jgi:cell division septation protein DedD/transcription initiation factor TFIIIB Brf1 subunit/transcription initiation factor TFIIB